MPAAVDKWFYEVENMLLSLPTNSIILQRRQNGAYRLRWREKDEYGRITHRSKAVPEEIVDDMQRVVEKVRLRRDMQRRRERTNQIKNSLRKKNYKALRRKIRDKAPGGRIAKQRAVEFFDTITDTRDFKLFRTYMENGCWLLPWRKPGRPRKGSIVTPPPQEENEVSRNTEYREQCFEFIHRLMRVSGSVTDPSEISGALSHLQLH